MQERQRDGRVTLRFSEEIDDHINEIVLGDPYLTRAQVAKEIIVAYFENRKPKFK